MSVRGLIATWDRIAMPAMSGEVELAWCAGLFEGEGSVASNNNHLYARLYSTDFDVLDRLLSITQVGRINGPYPPNAIGRKPISLWAAYGREARDLLKAMRPYFGERRRDQVDRHLAIYEGRPRRSTSPKPTGPIYISGPMTGVAEHNYPAFSDMAARLRDIGADVISPHELSNPDDSADWSWFLRRDIAELVKCQSIVLLDNWIHSRGAKLERYIARQLGMQIFYPDEHALLFSARADACIDFQNGDCA
ncbi:MAG: hypothetical protein CK431_04495 [Mycobacterium sp.]|nr:MAG: hypothetical protein CK431_04495 [Mycobacterium sp.]